MLGCTLCGPAQRTCPSIADCSRSVSLPARSDGLAISIRDAQCAKACGKGHVVGGVGSARRLHCLRAQALAQRKHSACRATGAPAGGCRCS